MTVASQNARQHARGYKSKSIRFRKPRLLQLNTEIKLKAFKYYYVNESYRQANESYKPRSREQPLRAGKIAPEAQRSLHLRRAGQNPQVNTSHLSSLHTDTH